MIGIYKDEFLDLLKQTVGEPIKITNNQIICRCPWCEFEQEKDHYHLWISLDAPIFNCFHCADEAAHKGIISKLIRKLHGSDISDNFVDRDKIKEFIQTKVKLSNVVDKKVELSIPPLQEELYSHKASYLRGRLKYSDVDLNSIKGLIFDIQQFININPIPITDTLERLQPFLHSNFIGFLTENNSTLILRNIDPTSSFRYYKLKISDGLFLDYYKIKGFNPNSKNIVLAEGIFDIFSEQIFDHLGLRQDILLYATTNSKKFHTLVKSIVFNESIFRPNVYILSDRGINIEEYKKMAHYNKHLINSLIVYYNKIGKDFNDVPCIVEKIQIK